jgi:hypothetical protein
VWKKNSSVPGVGNNGFKEVGFRARSFGGKIVKHAIVLVLSFAVGVASGVLVHRNLANSQPAQSPTAQPPITQQWTETEEQTRKRMKDFQVRLDNCSSLRLRTAWRESLRKWNCSAGLTTFSSNIVKLSNQNLLGYK